MQNAKLTRVVAWKVCKSVNSLNAMSSHRVSSWEQKCQPRKFLFHLKIWNSLTWCSASNQTLSAQVEETCRNGAIDPGSSRDRRSTWIQMRGKHKPSSPKQREKDDILQLASIKAKCTTETVRRFKKIAAWNFHLQNLACKEQRKT